MNKKQWLKGDVMEGRVKSLDHHGAWIEVHEDQIFMPIAEIAWYEIEHPSEIMSIGEIVGIEITGKHVDGSYKCTLSQLRPEDEPELVTKVIVEIAKGESNQYEINPSNGEIRLTQVLSSPLHYPGDYGFIPNTLEENGEPLRVIILITEPTFTGCQIECRIIGLLQCAIGERLEYKLLAVPTMDPRFHQVYTLSKVPTHTLKEIVHFFKIYNELAGEKSMVIEWKKGTEAKKVFHDSKKRYERN